jgi:hypothetical protein
MRTARSVAVLICVAVLSAQFARADDADVRAVIAKSIKAVGGEANLKKHQAVTWKESGIYYGMGDGLPYTGQFAMQFPDKFRMEIVGVFVNVVNGDQGWTSLGGDTREMTKEELDSHKDNLYAGWITTLLPLSHAKYKLSAAGEIKVDDRSAVGVRVSSEGRRDVSLYFDKETHLLVKTERRALAEGKKEVTEESYFREFKVIDGVKMATKMLVTQDGKKFLESEVTELKAEGKLGDAVFGKP